MMVHYIMIFCQYFRQRRFFCTLRNDEKRKQTLLLGYDNRFCFCLFSMVNLTENSALGLSISNGVFGSLALPTCLGYQRVWKQLRKLVFVGCHHLIYLAIQWTLDQMLAGSMTAQGDARTQRPF